MKYISHLIKYLLILIWLSPSLQAAKPPKGSRSSSPPTAQITQKKGYTRLQFNAHRVIPYTITQKGKVLEITFECEGQIKISGPQQKFKIMGNDPKPSRLKIELTENMTPQDFRQGNSVMIDLYPQLKETPAPPRPKEKTPSAALSLPSKLSDSFPLSVKEDTLTLTIPGKKEGGAALFTRRNKVFAFFDQPTPFSKTTWPIKHHGVKEVEGFPPYSIAITLEEGYQPFLQKKDGQWTLTFKKNIAPDLGAPLLPLIKVKSNGHKYLLVKTAKAGQILKGADPEPQGGDLIVVPLISGTAHIAKPLTSFEFHLYPTSLGMGIKPLSDDLDVRQSAEGIEIHSPNGLWLLEDNEQTPSSALPPLSLSLFNLESLGYPQKSWIEVRRLLNLANGQSSPADKNKHRLNLAKFYIATNFVTEGVELLRNLIGEMPALKSDALFLTYTGIGSFLKEDYTGALSFLSSPPLADEPELNLWASLAKMLKNNDTSLLEEALKGKDFISTYPPRIKIKLTLLLAQLSLKARKVKEAKELLQLIPPQDPSGTEKNQIRLLLATIAEQEGLPLESKQILEGVAQTGDTKSRTQAQLRLLMHSYTAHKITPQKVIETLKGLEHQWRGDDLEHMILTQLATLYFKEGDYRKSFEILESLLLNFPGHGGNTQVLKDLQTQFHELFSEKKAKALPPLKAISLYEDMKKYASSEENFLPILQGLATQLGDMDLLEEAATLLSEPLASSKLDPLKKVEVGAQVAGFYLRNNKPQKTLEILSQTAAKKDMADQVPSPLSRERRHLEAKASAKLGHYGEAAMVIHQDNSEEALLLKRNIYLAMGQWSEAAQILQTLVDQKVTLEKAPTSQERRLILDLAISAALAKEKNYLVHLREKYKPLMDKSDDKDAFDLVTTGEEPTGPLTPLNVDSQIKKATQFSQALEDYRKRLS
jgi:hypothetical protein